MAIKLLAKEEAKSFLVIEHADDDKLVETLIQQAHARLQGYLGRGLDAYSRTEEYNGGKAGIFLRHWPVSSVTSVTDQQGTVATGDDEVLETTEYRLEGETGILWRTTHYANKRLWEPGQQRFKVVYTGGMEASTEWDDFERDELAGSLRDLVAYWYRHRDPQLIALLEGAGMGERWEPVTESLGLPMSVKSVWDSYAVRG